MRAANSDEGPKIRAFTGGSSSVEVRVAVQFTPVMHAPKSHAPLGRHSPFRPQSSAERHAAEAPSRPPPRSRNTAEKELRIVHRRGGGGGCARVPDRQSEVVEKLMIKSAKRARAGVDELRYSGSLDAFNPIR